MQSGKDLTPLFAGVDEMTDTFKKTRRQNLRTAPFFLKQAPARWSCAGSADDYVTQRRDFGRSMTALSLKRTSKPNRPSMGLSAGSSWQATRSLTYIIRRPASLSRGYSCTKGDRVTVRQGFVRVHGDAQAFGLHETIVNVVPVWRMGQQASTKRCLGAGIHSIHGNEQPFSMESFSDLIDRFIFHCGTRIP